MRPRAPADSQEPIQLERRRNRHEPPPEIVVISRSGGRCMSIHRNSPATAPGRPRWKFAAVLFGLHADHGLYRQGRSVHCGGRLLGVPCGALA